MTTWFKIEFIYSSGRIKDQMTQLGRIYADNKIQSAPNGLISVISVPFETGRFSTEGKFNYPNHSPNYSLLIANCKLFTAH